MDGAFAFDAFRRIGTNCAGDDFSLHFGHVAISISGVTGTNHAVAAAQTHTGAGGKTLVLLGRLNHEVILFNPDFFGKYQFAVTQFRLFRIDDNFHFFFKTIWYIGEHQFKRTKNGHATLSMGVEFAADRIFQACNICVTIELGDAHPFAEVYNGLGRIASAAHTADSGHARVVPTGNKSLLHHLAQFALAHHGVRDVQT